MRRAINHIAHRLTKVKIPCSTSCCPTTFSFVWLQHFGKPGLTNPAFQSRRTLRAYTLPSPPLPSPTPLSCELTFPLTCLYHRTCLPWKLKTEKPLFVPNPNQNSWIFNTLWKRPLNIKHQHQHQSRIQCDALSANAWTSTSTSE